jgi:GGDEF domain-containing protein
MLRAPWGHGLAGFALLAALAVHLLAMGGLPSRDELMPLVLPVLLPALLAGTCGAFLRRADIRREGARVDAATGLSTRQGLLAWGEDLLDRSRRRGHATTLAVFDCADLLEVRRIYGSAVARQLALRVAGKLSAMAGKKGLAARTGPAEFSVLLPGASREQALQLVRQVLGAPCRIEFESGRTEIVLLPDFILAVSGEDEDDVAGLYGAAARKLSWAREHEMRRQRYLRRERERHSRPMVLAGETPSRAAIDPLDPTMPTPLAVS